MKLYESKRPKPHITFTTNFQRQRIIQIILPSLKVLLESSFKASRNFKDFDPSKLHWIQALKPQRTSITNFQRTRKFKKPTKNTKNTKNAKYKKSLTSTQPKIQCNFIPKIFNLLSNPSEGYLVFESRLHWCNTWIEDFFNEIELDDYSTVLESKYKKLYLQIYRYKFTLVKCIQLFDF